MQTPDTCSDAGRTHDQLTAAGVPPLSRRAVLAGGGVALGAFVLPNLTAGSAFAAAGEFDTLRQRWRDLFLGTGFDATAEPFSSKLAAIGRTASGFLDTLAPQPGALWPDLNYDDPDPNTDTDSYNYSARMNTTITRLRQIAEAVRQPGTGLTGDSAATKIVIDGVDQLNREVYGDGIPRFGNWWNFQIGGAQDFMTTAILIFDDLGADQRAAYAAAVDYYVPDSTFDHYTGTSTGANRVDLCLSVILRSLLADNADRLTLARDALSPVFPYVTTGDGYYADGSFIQHTNIPYIGGYGAVLVSGLGRLFALLHGSSFEVTDPNQSLFLDTIDNALAPFIYNGLMMDCVSGRGITRQGGSDHTRGHAVLPSVALIAKGAAAEQAQRWRGMLKGWVQRDSYDEAVSNGLGLVQLADMQQVINDDSVVALDEPVEHRVFGNMDRATHRRPGWAAAISAASKRISYYETGNHENKRGWHTGSGWLQWWLADDLGQYSDAYWPTVDPYRLPGITVSKKHLADEAGGQWANPTPDVAWVGGSTDGEFGAYGQHLIGFQSTLQARKSWFSLDSYVVCLGAGISSQDAEAAETVYDNRALGEHGTAKLIIDDRTQPTVQGWSKVFDNPRWAHLDGQAGYVFLQPTELTALRDERTGAWHDINDGGSTDPITRRYLTLYTDHGVRPSNASYGYLLVPGASAHETRSLAHKASGRIHTQANTAAQQGIRVPTLGLTAVNFWQPGRVGDVSASAPASVLIRQLRGTATICVSDPGRQVTGLDLVWRHPVSKVLSAPDTVSSSKIGRELRISFGDLTGQAGATQRVVVKLA
ncbi:polysaccharide lyase 8 family protein [Microlunatus elymi]|uniref:Polysaccharide lyase 8 family protein n=1 Tax=Microlunatus elymi TaxID=2596828 RepID=A0A516Q1N1_9ACTN|nr:polysaccharide lyase 8 family protein [Microlunatus elymi]QDP97345.1 polysaccharide lyase 8 family protein [Microlunatus elymi]